jgi:hypothetical protein
MSEGQAEIIAGVDTRPSLTPSGRVVVRARPTPSGRARHSERTSSVPIVLFVITRVVAQQLG